jgi:hypothetical protein
MKSIVRSFLICFTFFSLTVKSLPLPENHDSFMVNYALKQPVYIIDRVLVRGGVKGAAAPVNFGQHVHAPVNFQT